MAKKRANAGLAVQWKLSTKEAAYVNDIMDEDGFGNQPSTIVHNVFWEGIRVLIDRGSITRRSGVVDPKDI